MTCLKSGLSDKLVTAIGRSELEEDMQKRLEEKHRGKIWQGVNGKWFTYVEGSDKRKLIVRKTRKEIDDYLLNYYKIIGSEKEFGFLFESWNDRRLTMKQIRPGTHSRNITDYNKFFKCTIGRIRVDKASPFDYVSVMERAAAEFDVSPKGMGRLKGIVKGVINYARRLGIVDYTGNAVIEEYNALGIKLKKSYKEDYEEVYSDEEMQKVMCYLSENRCDVNNAIFLIFLTGMRVGECVALKHSDFSGNAIQIRRTETSWTEDGVFYREVRDSPKTAAGYRTIVVPSSYEWFLELLRKQNTFKEWLFYGSDGRRLSDNYVQRRLKNICIELGIYPKSPHKIRKTYCSILLDNKCDSEFIKQQVGHTDIWCTEHFYHRNRRDIEQKTVIIDSVPEFNRTMINGDAETQIH